MKILITAKPGSGKTTAIVNLLRERITGGVPPTRICALTFTKKAAEEMKDRIATDQVRASTIHSLAYQIVKEEFDADTDEFYAQMIQQATQKLVEGYRPPFSVLAVDEAQDIDKPQADFLRALIQTVTDVIVVGDPMQSIYGFRGNDPSFMSILLDNPERRTLDTSHRVPSEITKLIKRVFPVEYHFEPARIGGSAEIIDIPGTQGMLITRAKASEYDGTVGILFRTNAEITRFVRSVEDQSKYNFVVPITEDLTVALTILALTAHHGIDPDILKTVSEYLGYSSWESGALYHRLNTLRGNGYQITIDFLKNIVAGTESSPFLQPYAVRKLAEFLSILEYIAVTDDVTEAAVYRTLARIREDDYATLYNFDIPDGEMVTMIRDTITSGIPAMYEVNNHAARTVSTVHAAKGREYDSVVHVVTSRNDTQNNEELRILYVAMTRARENLSLIVPVYGSQPDNHSIMWRVIAAAGIV